MKRRQLLAGGTVGLLSTAGCVGLIRAQLSGDSDGAEASNETNDTEDTPNTEHPENGNTSRDENTSNDTDATDNESANETEYAEAQDPEPEPEGPETNESAINESNATEDPTGEDVILSDTELVTESNTATVTGTATNESDEPLTVDLEVQFLQDGEQLGRPALGGTTGLQPSDSWEFSITARGGGAGEATDYEIAKTVRVQG